MFYFCENYMRKCTLYFRYFLSCFYIGKWYNIIRLCIYVCVCVYTHTHPIKNLYFNYFFQLMYFFCLKFFQSLKKKYIYIYVQFLKIKNPHNCDYYLLNLLYICYLFSHKKLEYASYFICYFNESTAFCHGVKI